MLRTVMLLGTLTGILLAVGFILGGLWGTTFALIFALAINFSTYWWSDKIVLKIYRAKPLDDKEMQATVETIASKAGIPQPRLYIVQSEVPNAFATGRDPKHSAIAVTKGLMGLDRDEMEGVLAHEMAHIKNRDVLVSTLAATIAGAISWVAQIGYWSLFTTGDRRGEGNLLAFVLIVIFAPLAALLVRLAISRGREFGADHTGVLITRKPLALASALRKISEKAKQTPMRGNTATSHMWIVNPFTANWFTGIFSTHPPIERRVARLEEIAQKKE